MSKTVVFALSPEIPNDGVAVAGDLDAGLKQRITDALLAYGETEEGSAVLTQDLSHHQVRPGRPRLPGHRPRGGRRRSSSSQRRRRGAPREPARPPAPERLTMIRFQHASVTYRGGVRALRDLTLDIPDGQFLVLVGLSGAGKSTLIRAINGLVPISGGVGARGRP